MRRQEASSALGDGFVDAQGVVIGPHFMECFLLEICELLHAKRASILGSMQLACKLHKIAQYCGISEEAGMKIGRPIINGIL